MIEQFQTFEIYRDKLLELGFTVSTTKVTHEKDTIIFYFTVGDPGESYDLGVDGANWYLRNFNKENHEWVKCTCWSE